MFDIKKYLHEIYILDYLDNFFFTIFIYYKKEEKIEFPLNYLENYFLELQFESHS